MDILIFEYITGGGMIDDVLPSSLVREGEIMLKAVANDFSAIPDVQISTLRDYRLTNKVNCANEIVIKSGMTSIGEIEKHAQQLDALLIIAPETNNVLADLCERFSNQLFVLLNSNIESIKLTTNKYNTYKNLQAHDVPQIPTCLGNEIDKIHADKYVIKPIDGVGCENLSILDNRDELKRTLAKIDRGQYIIQPFIKGMHASLSLLCWDGECLLLSGNEQCLIQQGGTFILQKCNVNALERDKYISFSKKLIKNIPGLRGYVGVDVLLTKQDILLVEINPRLTISYVGLKKALGINPAKLMLECFFRKQIPILASTQNNMVIVEVEANRAA